MDDPVDALYALPPAEFTAVRDELAKRLRSGGDKETAAAVKALRRPTLAAFAVNLAARGARKELRAVLDAADALRAAHEALLAGKGDARAVRSASESERAAASAFVAAAVKLADDAGASLSDAAIAKVRETVHAAALDEDVRDALAAGRLEREVEAASEGLLGGFASAEPGLSRAEPDTPTSRRTGAGGAKAQREAAKRALAGAERDLKKAEGGAKAARTRLDDAETAAAQARERLERAEAELEDARARCERAQAELRTAKEAVAKAHEEAER